jgi:hypothetical protein
MLTMIRGQRQKELERRAARPRETAHPLTAYAGEYTLLFLDHIEDRVSTEPSGFDEVLAVRSQSRSGQRVAGRGVPSHWVCIS